MPINKTQGRRIMAENISQSEQTQSNIYSYCSLPEVPERVLSPEVNPHRANLILQNDKKWVNGTVLHYYFFDQPSDGQRIFFANGTSEFRSWTTSEAEKNIVRQAFKMWADIGIGLKFE
ncbi:MAG: hypothetical protein F6K24_57435, partial [Okeania sp. SIO2D1]|nr:hypothetical protein [Okeania sp. SIO2D1]